MTQLPVVVALAPMIASTILPLASPKYACKVRAVHWQAKSIANSYNMVCIAVHTPDPNLSIDISPASPSRKLIASYFAGSSLTTLKFVTSVHRQRGEAEQDAKDSRDAQ